MKTRIQKWGNSLALRIPKSFADEVGLKQGSPVEVSLEDRRLVIAAAPKFKLPLKQLLPKTTATFGVDTTRRSKAVKRNPTPTVRGIQNVEFRFTQPNLSD